MTTLDRFTSALLAAGSHRGGLTVVAELLGVPPKTVYLWIAGVDLPASLDQERYIAVLSAPGARHASPWRRERRT